MIKKRLLSFLGAAAITAALTFAVVSLSPSNGFTSGTMQEGLCYEATGVAPDAIVASLNGQRARAPTLSHTGSATTCRISTATCSITPARPSTGTTPSPTV